MNRQKILLGIGEKSAAFEKMERTLGEYFDVTVCGLDGYSLSGYDIFIGKKLTAEALASADRLKAIFAYKTGVDDFPLIELSDKKIPVYNSHADSEIIAEYAFSLSLSLTFRVTEFDRNLREGIWYDNVNPYWTSLFCMKVGLLGYGHIGRAVHGLLLKNGIAAYTIDRGKSCEDITTVPDLESLCKECDLIIASLPKVGDTDNLFDGKMLKLMRGKYLVNVGRSNCIDQKALYESLLAGELAGAAVDTWDSKPKTTRHTLKPSKYDFEKLPNIILSPHAAMRVKGGHERYVEDTTENVLRYLRGEQPLNEVDLVKGY